MEVCEEDELKAELRELRKQDSELQASNKGEESTVLKGKEAVTVSIDVTKALLLLGLPTWSSLEPGKYILSQFYINHCKAFKYTSLIILSLA